jgi:hypothetical protein
MSTNVATHEAINVARCRSWRRFSAFAEERARSWSGNTTFVNRSSMK